MKKILRFLLTITLLLILGHFIFKFSWKQTFICIAITDSTSWISRKIHEINERYTSDESNENNENNY